jgi:GT2 family glycosyltransferase
MTTTLPRSLTAAESTLSEPLVCCVLLNWNGWQDTVECLRALALQRYPNLHLIVVDNASTDDSVQRILESCPPDRLPYELICTPQNLGFSGGCNAGIRRALDLNADFVWLLNNDTIAPPDTLTRLLDATHPRAGITGTVLYYHHNPTVVQAWGGGKVLPWIGYVTHFTQPEPFGPNTYLTFASVLIRRQVFSDIGLLDERFFMYFDDSDFCFRASHAGWQLAIAADTAVLHKEGGSTNGDGACSNSTGMANGKSNGNGKNLRMERIVTTSGLLFLRRHSLIPPVSMSLFVLSRVGKRLLLWDIPCLRAVMLGVSDWWRNRTIAFKAEV